MRDKDAEHVTEKICPFCKKKVIKEEETISGCAACAKDWMDNEQVDHPVG